jgi:predicted deacylase
MSHALGLLLLAAAASGAVDEAWAPVEILGESVQPGTRWRLAWLGGESFAGDTLPAPVQVVRGGRPGRTLCLTAGIHGDELNGIEIVRRVLLELDPNHLAGMVVGVPIVNLHGFRRSSRYLPDRRDLNRYFPGRPRGSSASRIAHSLFEEVIHHCDAVVDIHTGTFHRANIPQLRANLAVPEVLALARGFGAEVVVHSVGGRGTLRRAATDAGIPAITYEGGEPMRFQTSEVDRGVNGVLRLLGSLDMLTTLGVSRERQEVYTRSRWIRVDEGGILLSRVELGDRVQGGDVLGTVTDPISNETTQILAPESGRVIGLALNQVVIPGFATHHLGVVDAEGQYLPLEEEAEEHPEGPDPDAEILDLDERPE